MLNFIQLFPKGLVEVVRGFNVFFDFASGNIKIREKTKNSSGPVINSTYIIDLRNSSTFLLPPPPQASFTWWDTTEKTMAGIFA